MTTSCYDRCGPYKVSRGSKEYKYAYGVRPNFKRCRICDIFMIWDGRRCPCCRGLLSMRPRQGYSGLSKTERKRLRAALDAEIWETEQERGLILP